MIIAGILLSILCVSLLFLFSRPKWFLNRLGYWNAEDLVNAAKRFSDKQMKERNRLIEESVEKKDEKLGKRALDEGYQGVGATRFVREFLNKSL